MALTTPILNSVPTWSVVNGQTFTFNVIGGDAVVGNKLTIINNATATVVYTLTTTTFQYRAIVPANASGLANGNYYSAYVQTIDSSNNLSSPSNSISFHCYATPSWGLNITQGAIIGNSSLAPIATYSSTGEALSDYTFTLYNSGQTELVTSGLIYTGNSSLSQSVTYNFFGLEDNTAYYIRAIGHTVGGVSLDTGYIGFTVSYLQPESYDILFLQNNCQGGYINYYSQAYVIGGFSVPSTPTYTTNGINLRNNGSYVEWNSGFSIPTDFTLKAWVQQPKLGTTLFTLYADSNNYIIVDYIQDPVVASHGLIILQVYMNGQPTYFIYSNSFVKPSSSKVLCIQIRCIDDLYEAIVG